MIALILILVIFLSKKFELNNDQIIIFWILVLFWSAISIIRAYRKLYAITPIEQGGLSLTPVLAAQIAAEQAAQVAIENGMKQIEIKIKGPGSGREASIRSIQATGLEVTRIVDITPVPHNGARPPKKRRP